MPRTSTHQSRNSSKGSTPALVKHVTVFSTGFEGNKEMAVGFMKDLTGAEEFARSVLAG